MKQLRIRTLAGLFVAAGLLSWAGASLWDALGTLPGVPFGAPIVLAALAAVLLATALSLRSRLVAQRERRPDARGVEPFMAARAAIFGQASALVGALVAGVYAGTCLYLLLNRLEVPARRDQAVYAGLAVAAGVALVAAALFVQYVCRLPEDDEEDPAAPPEP